MRSVHRGRSRADEHHAPSHAAGLLELRGIVKNWGPLRVLDGVDLCLEPGTITHLVGANGVGKTTLIRIAAGFLRPNEGSVTIAGLTPDRDRKAYYAKLGLLTAGGLGLYARLTVQHNLEFLAAIAMLHGAKRRETVEAALRRFDLVELADRRSDRLSMGQRQRLRLAVALLNEPTVLLMDEPRTSLDEQGLAVLTDSLAELTARGGAALWCSPNGEAQLPSDRTCVLEHGRLTFR